MSIKNVSKKKVDFECYDSHYFIRYGFSDIIGISKLTEIAGCFIEILVITVDDVNGYQNLLNSDEFSIS